MRKFSILFINLLVFGLTNIEAQFLPNFYPVLESNKGVANRKLNYNLFQSTSGNVSPADSASFNTYLTSATFKNYGTTSLAFEKGTINTTTSTQYNALNWNNSSQLQNAVFSGATPYSGFGDYFGFVVSGYFIPKETGTYTFTIEADDADELVINNKFVVGQYGAHGPSAIGTHTGTIGLVAGLRYQFRVRMQEYATGEALNVFWQKPSESASGNWYQDVEELSSLNVINNGIVQKIDFNNFYSYPLSGTKAYNILNNDAGTISGATFNSKVGGFPSSSLYFNGNGQYVDFGTSPSNFPTGDLTASVWINFSKLDNASWNIFMSKWFNGAVDGGAHDFHYSVKYNGSNYKQNLFTTSGATDFYGNNVISPNTWYNLGFTLTNGGALQFYLNGVADGNALSPVSRTLGTANYYIGDPRAGTALCFTGYISDVNIYNRALTPAEMLSNYNSLKNNFSNIVQNGLVMNLINPASSGTTWADISGNGNNATIVGSPTYTSSNGGGYTTSSTSYISTNYNLPSSFTVSVASSLNPSTFWATIWGNESWNAAKGFIAYLGSTTNMNFGSPSGQAAITVSGINTIHIWDYVFDGTNYVLYKDGVSIGSGTFANPSSGLSTTGLYFGARHGNGGTSYTDACPGTYYSMRVYNRALNSSEVSQNFNVLRGNYGL